MAISIYNLFGYAGAALFILSYFLLSKGTLKANESTYQTMNVFGALCLIINAMSLSDIPTVLVNGAWLIIGLSALIRIKNQNNL